MPPRAADGIHHLVGGALVAAGAVHGYAGVVDNDLRSFRRRQLGHAAADAAAGAGHDYRPSFQHAHRLLLLTALARAGHHARAGRRLLSLGRLRPDLELDHVLAALLVLLA